MSVNAAEFLNKILEFTPYAALQVPKIRCEGVQLNDLRLSNPAAVVIVRLNRQADFDSTLGTFLDELEDGEALESLTRGIEDCESEAAVVEAYNVLEALKKALPPICLLKQLGCDRDISAVPAFCAPFMGPDADPDPDELTPAADLALDQAGIEKPRRWSRLDYYPDEAGMIRYAYINGFRGGSALDDFEPTAKDRIALDRLDIG